MACSLSLSLSLYLSLENVRTGDTHTGETGLLRRPVTNLISTCISEKARKVSFPDDQMEKSSEKKRKAKEIVGKTPKKKEKCCRQRETEEGENLPLASWPVSLSLQGRARRSRSRMFRFYPRAVRTPVRSCRPLVSDTQPSCVAARLARRADAFGAVASGESD